MSSLVLELQRDALDKNVLVSDLLRKALVVARKLKISEFQEWIQKELEGYKEGQEVPDYRFVRGDVKVWNPYHGWQPIFFSSAEKAEIFSKRACGQRIAEIENLLEGKSDGSFQMPFSKKIEQHLQKSIDFDTTITLITSEIYLIRTLDAVRNIVLNWSMKLEEDGILGEGMSFTENEKNEVSKHSYVVTNFYGDVIGSQIQQGTEGSKQQIGSVSINTESIQEFVSLLKSKLDEVAFSGDDKAEIEAEVTTIESQVKSPKPKFRIIKESLGTVRRILEGASGSVVAELLKQLGELF